MQAEVVFNFVHVMNTIISTKHLKEPSKTHLENEFKGKCKEGPFKHVWANLDCMQKINKKTIGKVAKEI
jgi:hypothetical protein